MRLSHIIGSLVIAAATIATAGCSTVPKEKDRASFIAESRQAVNYFESNVPGLRRQLSNSGGYVIYPNIGQWGIVFGGGRFGRGLVLDSRGTQVGWAAINTSSIGLQAGVQGFKMLVVFQNDATMQRFRSNQLTGSTGAVAVLGDASATGAAPFANGVAAYTGASTGLMAGVNVGFDWMRFEPLGTYQ